MKKIITALVLLTMIHFGAKAQTSECKVRPGIKHASSMHKHKQNTLGQSPTLLGIQGEQTITESCHMVPYEVCKINPDRRSVNCYKTVDSNDQVPLYPNEVSTYGPTGDLPGQDNRVATGAIIINAPAPANYCKRNEANNTIVCYSPGSLTRDDLGFYHYNLK